MNRTPEMLAADEEIEREFCFTLKELRETRGRDETAVEMRLDNREAKRKSLQREYNRRYYAKHKAEINERCRACYVANRERENARSAAWRKENQEYCSAFGLAYYDEHRAAILVKKQSEYEVNRALCRMLEAEGDEHGNQA